MAITQQFDLNMIPDSAPVVVHVDQYDEGEGRLVAKLYKNSVPYTPTTGATAVIQGTKPDGKGFDYNASISGGIVTADLTKQMTAVAGNVRVQIVITEGEDRTGTFVFILAVQKSALPSDTDMSESDFQIIEELLEEAEAINLNPPKIGQNGNWWVWDTTAHAYVDSGVDASITIDIGTVTTLPAGSDATVSNSGTATDPIFNFGIPKGDKGDSGDGVPTGGTTGQFLKKKSNTDYDTEWGTLGTAAALNVAASGDAGTSEVVKGDDTRLTDSRPASDVSAWAKAANKPSYTASEVGAIASTEKGANSGVAELDSAGKVPSAQLPSYVDDVLEYASLSAFPVTGETGKIYVALDTNKTYRWSGSAYVEISESLALGETSSTAYAGNKGKANADAIAAIKDGQSIDSFADVETALSGKQNTLTFDNAPTANSNNPVKSQGIKTAIDDSQKAQESLLRDTVGWTGKNKCPYMRNGTNNGVTYVIDENGVVDADGTASNNDAQTFTTFISPVDKVFILSGCNSGDSNIHLYAFDDTTNARPYTDQTKTQSQTNNVYNGNEVQFLAEAGHITRISFRVKSGNTVNHFKAYPMVRDASIADPTYEPYHESVEQLKFDRAEQAVLGAKNLLAVKTTNSNGNGATITFNDDNSITFNGTPSEADAYVQYNIRGNASSIKIPNGSYIFSGCPKGGSTSTYWAKATCTKNGSSYELGFDTGDGCIIDVNGDDYFQDGARIQFNFYIKKNYTANNIIFYPMLRLSSDPDDTYAPYAMTNKKLTDEKAEASAITNVENGSTSSKSYGISQHFYRNGAFCTCISPIEIGGSFTLNTNYKEGTVGSDLDFLSNYGGYMLRSGNDLNNATYYTKYNATTSDIAASLLHCPISNAFKMICDFRSANNLTQIITTTNKDETPPAFYYRRRISESSWTDWYKLTGTVVS